MATDDRLTAALEEISANHRVYGDADAVPRLIAAVEDLGGETEKWQDNARALNRRAQVTSGGVNAAVLACHARVLEECAGVVRDVLLTALLGEGTSSA